MSMSNLPEKLFKPVVWPGTKIWEFSFINIIEILSGPAKFYCPGSLDHCFFFSGRLHVCAHVWNKFLSKEEHLNLLSTGDHPSKPFHFIVTPLRRTPSVYYTHLYTCAPPPSPPVPPFHPPRLRLWSERAMRRRTCCQGPTASPPLSYTQGTEWSMYLHLQ